jgi:broad specificity phosphatase PhoE
MKSQMPEPVATDLILIRHAPAETGGRLCGRRDVPARLPEAAALVRLRVVLGEVAALRVSPALRCRQTVEPLAAKLGIEIEMVPDLVEGRRAAPVVAMINRLVAAGSSAVLSSHGDMIPLVLDALSATGIPLAGDKCQKGSIWELRTADGHILEGRYLGRP